MKGTIFAIAIVIALCDIAGAQTFGVVYDSPNLDQGSALSILSVTGGYKIDAGHDAVCALKLAGPGTVFGNPLIGVSKNYGKEFLKSAFVAFSFPVVSEKNDVALRAFAASQASDIVGYAPDAFTLSIRFDGKAETKTGIALEIGVGAVEVMGAGKIEGDHFETYVPYSFGLSRPFSGRLAAFAELRGSWHATAQGSFLERNFNEIGAGLRYKVLGIHVDGGVSVPVESNSRPILEE